MITPLENTHYLRSLCNKIKDLQGENCDLYKLISTDINKFMYNILYKSPEQLPYEFNIYNRKIGNLISDWIEKNEGHESEFALALKEWVLNYFKEKA